MAVNDRIAAYRVCLSQIAPDDIETRVGASVNSTMASVSSARRRNPSQQAQPIGA